MPDRKVETVGFAHLCWAREAKRKAWYNSAYAVACFLGLFLILYFYVGHSHSVRGETAMQRGAVMHLVSSESRNTPVAQITPPKMVMLENTVFIPSVPALHVMPKQRVALHMMQRPLRASNPSNNTRHNLDLTHEKHSTQAAQSSASSEAEAHAKGNAWQRSVMERLERFRSYPADARAEHDEGITVLRLLISRRGDVLGATVNETSGSNILDEEAINLAHRVSPLPQPPSEIIGDPLVLLVPVSFQLSPS